MAKSTQAASTEAQPNQPGIIEAFAGIGSVARGFAEGASYRTLLLNDLDSVARKVYLAHSGEDAPYLACDIRHLRTSTIVGRVQGRPIVGVLGCPPCQGFSDAGRRLADDPRNRLVGSFFRLVEKLRPRFFVMENVAGLLNYNLFQARLGRITTQYSVCSGVLNAALYGLPQTRRRLIIIGYDREFGVTPTLPAPTHLGSRQVFDYGSQSYVSPSSKEGIVALGLLEGRTIDWSEKLPAYLLKHGPQLKDLVRVGDVIDNLPPARVAAYRPLGPAAGSSYSGESLPEGISDHVAWNHRPETVQRLSRVSEGGVLHGDGLRGRSRKYFSQAYSRLHRDGLARTITTNFHNAGCGRFLHYEHLRTLTVREAARIQGIPDSFRFDVEPSVAERLIGNAFPQPLAKAIATHIHAQMGEL